MSTGGDAKPLWVGLWGNRRQVVFDPALQPTNDELIFLYFVQGRALCTRSKAADRGNVRTIHDAEAIKAAVNQYERWRSQQSPQALAEKSRSANAVEAPPPPLVPCRACGGNPHAHYTVGTFSDGAHSDGVNVVESCDACHGAGYVSDVFSD